jgi:hypothetical protein
MKMIAIIPEFIEYAISPYSSKFEATRIKLLEVSRVGFFGFPIFYFVWNDYIKQPYENMTIRILCSILCGVCWVLLSSNTESKRNYKMVTIVFSYFTTIACLPCFFSYMALKNGLNPVWIGSLIASILYTILMLDLFSMFTAQLIGQSAGAILFLLENDQNMLPEICPLISLYYYLFLLRP